MGQPLWVWADKAVQVCRGARGVDCRWGVRVGVLPVVGRR